MLRVAADPQLRQLHDLITRQYDVLHNRGGVLLTFCGVVITTTGFSGRIIAGTNRWAQGLIIAGVAAVLAAAWVVLVRVMRVRWVTREALDGGPEALRAVLRERDRRTRTFRRAIYLAMFGMTLYVLAIMIMLWLPERDVVELNR